MAYDSLKTAVAQVIRANGQKEITGPVLDGQLNAIIDALADGGYAFQGVATTNTVPGTPDHKVFYIGGAGTYANFGSSVTVPEGKIVVFMYDNSAWSSQVIKIAEPVSVSQNTLTIGGEDKGELAGQYSTDESFIHIICDKYGRILCGILSNADVFFSKGCPQQIKDYFVPLFNQKVDKVDGKSLIDTQYIQETTDDFYIRLILDEYGRIITALKSNGGFKCGKIESPTIDELSNNIDAKVDKSESLEVINTHKLLNFSPISHITHFNTGLTRITGLNILKDQYIKVKIQANGTHLLFFSIEDESGEQVISADFIKVNQDLTKGIEFYFVAPCDIHRLRLYTNVAFDCDFYLSYSASQNVNPTPTGGGYILTTHGPKLYYSVDGLQYDLVKEYTLSGLTRDVFLTVINGVYYMFGSADGSNDIKIYTSQDLATFTLYATLTLDDITAPWEGFDNASNWWAPELYKDNDKWYLSVAAYFKKTGTSGYPDKNNYKVKPYMVELNSALTEVVNYNEVTGDNIRQEYDYDVTLMKLGDYYYEVSHSTGGMLSIGRSHNIEGPYNHYKDFPINSINTTAYIEGCTFMQEGDKILIFVTQDRINGHSLGVYICDTDFNYLGFQWLSNNESYLNKEHPYVRKATFKDLQNILNL